MWHCQGSTLQQSTAFSTAIVGGSQVTRPSTYSNEFYTQEDEAEDFPKAKKRKVSLIMDRIDLDVLNMRSGGPFDKILSCNDVVLRRIDTWILGGPYTLNDQIMKFYFSYLSTCYPSKDILFVPPDTAFCMKVCHSNQSLEDTLGPLHVGLRKLIIFPLNDNTDPKMPEGGRHWSLLAFERNSNVFVHHDPARGMNQKHAKRVYNSVRPYTAPNATYFECSRTPKQENGYDSGIYVTAIARTICSWYTSKEPKDSGNLWFSVIEELITPSLVSEMRREIPELLRSLTKM